MSAGWVAAQTRSRSLTSHCIGPAGAREIARSGSLDAALDIVATTAYGERARVGQNLRDAERSVAATVTWNLRVLAGWCPALGTSRLRVIAGVFELTNLEEELGHLGDHLATPPYELGSLASVTRQPPALNVSEFRDSLRRSPWGDPGTGDPDEIVLALRFSLIRRLVDTVPEAGAWAEAYGALLLARVVANGGSLAPGSPTAASARAVLGPRAVAARTLDELTRAIPTSSAAALAGITGPDDLWRGEARWWARLWREGDEGVRRRGAEPAAIVCALAAQLADAWRVRAALEIASRAGRGMEMLDAVA